MAEGGYDTEQDGDLLRFMELFHGRFNEAQATKLMTIHKWDVGTAANNVLNASSDDIAELLGDRATKEIHENITKNNVMQELARKNEIKDTVRLFACQPCTRVWWRRTPERKPVSQCNMCRTRYDAIPRDKEWGLAEFKCACGHEFLGKGAMGKTSSECYKCHQMCSPTKILPPFRRRGQRRNIPHSCSGRNCYNQSDLNEDHLTEDPGWASNTPYQDHLTNGQRQSSDVCVHPKSNPRKILYASQVHVSSGSTVNTFLPQDDLESLSFQSDLDSIPEGEDNM